MDKVAKEVTRQGVAKGRCAELGMRSGRLGHAWATCSGAGRVQRGGHGGREERAWTSLLAGRASLPGL
jgi:hypothetical protein